MNTLTRYLKFDPFYELNALRRQMERFIPSFPEQQMEPSLSEWTPFSDVLETKDSLIVRCDLPGLTREDITVELESGVLTIQGERTIEKETREEQYHRVERSYGKFFRRFPLPPNVIQDRIEAKYANGVLEVKIPKKEEAKARQIKIAA